MAEKTVTVRVTVPPRPQFHHGAYFCAGLRWPEGVTEREIPERLLPMLAADKHITVEEDGEIVTCDGEVNGSHEYLTPDESAVLAEYRAARTKKPDLAERYRPQPRLKRTPIQAPAPRGAKPPKGEKDQPPAGGKE